MLLRPQGQRRNWAFCACRISNCPCVGDRACRFKSPARVTTPGFCRYRPSQIRLLVDVGAISRLRMARTDLARHDDDLRRAVARNCRGLAAADTGRHRRAFLSCVRRLCADKSIESDEAESDDKNFAHFKFPGSFLLFITWFEASIRQRLIRR